MTNENVLEDLRETLLQCDGAACYFLAGRVSRAMEKNRFHLFFDRAGELTDLGEVAAGAFEALLVHGILKWR